MTQGIVEADGGWNLLTAKNKTKVVAAASHIYLRLK